MEERNHTGSPVRYPPTAVERPRDERNESEVGDSPPGRWFDAPFGPLVSTGASPTAGFGIREAQGSHTSSVRSPTDRSVRREAAGPRSPIPQITYIASSLVRLQFEAAGGSGPSRSRPTLPDVAHCRNWRTERRAGPATARVRSCDAVSGPSRPGPRRESHRNGRGRDENNASNCVTPTRKFRPVVPENERLDGGLRAARRTGPKDGSGTSRPVPPEGFW